LIEVTVVEEGVTQPGHPGVRAFIYLFIYLFLEGFEKKLFVFFTLSPSLSVTSLT
jgi:hypothetical protein